MAKYWNLILFPLYFALILLSGACQRPQSEPSTLRIAIPDVQGLQNKNQTQNAFPSGAQLCFAANITGESIPVSSETCLPKIGMMSAFVSHSANGMDATIQINEVPAGGLREVGIYMYSMPLGSSCPGGGVEVLKTLEPTSLFKVGAGEFSNTSGEEINLALTLSFPGASQYLQSGLQLCPGQSLPLPAHPSAGSSPSVSSGGGLMLGSQYKIRSWIGTVVKPDVLQGSSYKIQVKQE